jgi:MFS family permease
LQEQKNPALSPTVVKLGLVSLFADISSEMLYPITPIFLTTILGASIFDVGLIEGIAEGVASLLKTYSGSWSDHLQKRKTFVWAGYLFSALAKPITGAAGSWLHVLLARGFDRFGKGIRSSPRDALIAESIKPEFRGAAFGWHRGMDTLGAAIGPLLAISYLHFFQSPNHLRQIYFWALIPGLISVGIAFLVHDIQATTISKKAQTKLKYSSLNKEFKTYLLAWGLFSLANSSDVFLLLKAQHSGLSLTMTILFYSLYNLTYAFSSPYLGHLSDRMNRKTILAGGLIVFALVYGLFGFASSAWHFWILFFIYGLYMGATDGVGKAYAVDLVPAHLKATGLGLLGTVSGLATIAASSVAGLLWDQAGPQWTFLYGASGAILSVLVLLFMKPRAISG